MSPGERRETRSLNRRRIDEGGSQERPALVYLRSARGREISAFVAEAA
jgi:hypothetical protein